METRREENSPAAYRSTPPQLHGWPEQVTREKSRRGRCRPSSERRTIGGGHEMVNRCIVPSPQWDSVRALYKEEAQEHVAGCPAPPLKAPAAAREQIESFSCQLRVKARAHERILQAPGGSCRKQRAARIPPPPPACAARAYSRPSLPRPLPAPHLLILACAGWGVGAKPSPPATTPAACSPPAHPGCAPPWWPGARNRS